MNTKTAKRKRDLKTKLIAAVAMLLVSSLMMVTTTYAWFTLSTAPEVTGIQTAVGANGNLEMALMPLTGLLSDIKSEVGDSMNIQDKTKANITWGNLVDVSESYGLEKIMMYPSALNIDEAGLLNTSFPVAIPEYGVDGRVTTLAKTKAIPGSYFNNAFMDKIEVKEGEAATDQFMGVRAIGTASGASPAQLDYKAALVAASSAMANAIGKARGVLTDKGGALSDIAIRHVNGDDSSFTEADVTNLQAILTATLGTEEAPGSLLIIRNALKEYLVAYYIAGNSEGYETKAAEIRALTALDPDAGYVPAGMKAMITALNTSIEKAQQAQADLNTVKAATAPYTWTQLSPVVSKLADPTYMNLNGFAINELTQNVSALMKDVMNGKGIYLYLQSGAGIFVDIADFCGDYAAPVTIPEIKHDLLDEPLTDVDANMQTQSAIVKAGDPYLTQALDTVNATGGPAGAGAGSTLPLSDFYGYIIDLAFRTNVAGSNLQLQTVAEDRIYTGNEVNEDTMGGGSTMIFKSADKNFTANRIIDLMKHIKVVLFNPTNREIVKYLVITSDTNEIQVDADGTVTAPLYVAGADGKTPAVKTDESGNQIKDENDKPVKDPTIMAMDQNTAVQLSVLVYLDGTSLTNADVANAVSSMAGSLNLQFSSSAELIPMEYADLKNGTVTGTDEQPTTKDYAAGEFTITEGYAASNVKFGSYSGATAFAAAITKDGTAVTEGVTVTIAGKPATYNQTASAWVAPATDVTEAPASVAIVVVTSNP